MQKTEEEGWNVLLVYEKMGQVPAYLISAARFVVIHTSLLPSSGGPMCLFENQLKIDQNFSPVPSNHWHQNTDTGQWFKEYSLDGLPTATSTFNNRPYTHVIPFIVVDRQTNTTFLDVV